MKNGSAATTSVITNTGTDYVQIQINGPKTAVTLQGNVDRVSGTAAGTVVLKGSLDGVKFAQISGTTVTITNVASTTFFWTFTNNPYLFYRIEYTGAGTMVCNLTGTAVAR